MQNPRTYILLLIVFVAMTCPAIAQTVQVEQKFDLVQMYIGDQAELSLSVTAPKGAKVAFPDIKEPVDEGTLLTPRVPDLEVVEVLGGDTVTLDDGFVKTTRRYAVTAFEPSIYTIDSLGVMVNGKEYAGKKVALKVINVDVDTTNVTQMCPPKGIEDNPFLWAEWYPLIIALLIVAILAAAIAWLVRRKRQGHPIKLRFRTIKKVLPHEKAMAEIDGIKQARLAVSDNQKEYYTQLTDTLRRYMEERFGFSAMEMTTSEIIERLKQEDQQKIDELRYLFETADLVKFARHATLINENDRNLVAAVDFINSTKTEEVTIVKKEQEELSEQDQKMRKTNIALATAIVIVSVVAVVLLALAAWRIIDLLT